MWVYENTFTAVVDNILCVFNHTRKHTHANSAFGRFGVVSAQVCAFSACFCFWRHFVYLNFRLQLGWCSWANAYTHAHNSCAKWRELQSKTKKKTHNNLKTKLPKAFVEKADLRHFSVERRKKNLKKNSRGEAKRNSFNFLQTTATPAFFTFLFTCCCCCCRFALTIHAGTWVAHCEPRGI